MTDETTVPPDTPPTPPPNADTEKPKGENSVNIAIPPSETPPSASPLEESKKVVEAMKEQNKLFAENIKKAEKLAADSLIAGRALAGQEITPDQQEIEGARNLLKGSGYEDELFPK